MKDLTLKKKFHRRKFFTGILPVSLGLLSLNSFAGSLLLKGQYPVEHKFDKISDQKMSYRALIALRYKEFINTMKGILVAWGPENTIKFLEEKAAERGIKGGQKMLKKKEDNSFASYISFLENPDFDNTMSFEYVEKTDKICEIKVTECLWATTFLEKNAGEIGYAHICMGDYSNCQGFNPKIKMIRDKTLMQGDAYCNHRYILED